MPVLPCECKSDSRGSTQGARFQDERYGKGRRLFTDSPLGSKQRCTVCGREVTKPKN